MYRIQREKESDGKFTFFRIIYKIYLKFKIPLKYENK